MCVEVLVAVKGEGTSWDFFGMVRGHMDSYKIGRLLGGDLPQKESPTESSSLQQVKIFLFCFVSG